jgi:hypothetical protein
MQYRIVASFNTYRADQLEYTRSFKILKLEEFDSPITRKKVLKLTVEDQVFSDIPLEGYEIYQPRNRDLNLKRVHMDFEEVYAVEDCYMWRLPWAVYYPPLNVWIPVLDSNFPMPGEYKYRVKNDTRERYEARVQEHTSVSESVILSLSNEPYRAYTISQPLRTLLEQPLQTLQPSAPPAPPSPPLPSAPRAPTKPPTFVADIMKGDAIKTGQACPISLEVFMDVAKIRMTPCFHLFEREHIEEWMKNTQLCPVCKASCSLGDCV